MSQLKHDQHSNPFKYNTKSWKSYNFRGCKKSYFWKSNMAAAAILNITKISISPERFDQFLRNLERWRQIGPLTVPAVKKIWISKIQDDGRPPFWKPLIRHISATVWPILMKFLRWRILAPYSGSTAKISYFWKSKMAADTTLKITKIVISPERSERSLRNWYSDAECLSQPLRQLKNLNFQNPI